MKHAFPFFLAGAFAVGMSSCSAEPAKSAPAAVADSAAPAGKCDASPLGWTIGQVADDALVERARKESNSDSVRVLRPGMMVTREYNGARLNLRVDNERKVLAYNCG
jgi:hypothetical protein